jgi:hypothetical protein
MGIDFAKRMKNAPPTIGDPIDRGPVVKPEDLVGQTVTVRSHRVNGAIGRVDSYTPRTHHYWVYLEKEISKKNGGKTNWHKCNAGNVHLIIKDEE